MKMTIGLEIHIKLRTPTKLFCRCINTQDFDAPNTHICPVCTAQPGGLPVVSPEPVEYALTLAQLLHCQIATQLIFDRKSYFYPDSPLGYQITQFSQPIMYDGHVVLYTNGYAESKTIRIHEAHLENDTAKMVHTSKTSMIDFNRSGTPLIEIVTKPDFHNPDDVIEFLKHIQRVVRRNNLGDADLEKGQMRVDVNISVSDTDQLGTRVEIKNLNSYGAIRRAIQYEYDRHTQNPASIQQSTVTRDDTNNCTRMMRSKEDAVDYRYFPEPDLPAISLIYNPAHNLMDPSGIIAQMRAAGLHKEYINTLIADRETIIYFHTMCQHISDPLLVAKWMSGVFRIDMFDQQVFVAFLQYAQTVSDFVAKQVFEKLIGGIPFDQAIIQEQSVGGYDQIINDILIEHQKVVDEYRGGKISAIGFLVGQMMKRTHGNLDPVQAKMLLENNIQKKSPK